VTAGMAPAALTVAVLGLGEAGGAIARDLAAAGVQVPKQFTYSWSDAAAGMPKA